MIWILILLLILAAALILCGYTTLRLPVRRGEEKRHIACVGDSVTYGCTLPLFFLRRYPAVLQKLLGPETQVAAFAVNDRTLQSTGNKPYRKEKAFRQSKAFLPDTVVILLGTNDSKDANWISDEAFRQQYRELIDEYRTPPSKPRILLCTPPCAFAPINRFFYITNDAKLDRIPEIAALLMAVAVCLSTLTTRQHVLPDIAGGILLSEICYACAGGKTLLRAYSSLINRILSGTKLIKEKLML